MRSERRTNGKRHKGERGMRKKKRRETSRQVGRLGVGLLEQSGAAPAANKANSGRQMKTNAANLAAGGATPSH